MSAGWESVAVEGTGTDNVLKIHCNGCRNQCGTLPSNPVSSIECFECRSDASSTAWVLQILRVLRVPRTRLECRLGVGACGIHWFGQVLKGHSNGCRYQCDTLAVNPDGSVWAGVNGALLWMPLCCVGCRFVVGVALDASCCCVCLGSP